ncbi:lysozyme inhibitor LprI family protein [Massilia rhizosphaerae]|uniref:lysozyme inhibitor LprI family protein n=1 Tax=Massilia rhizosphaerae TaxID=2784389 RepID=UPI0018DBCEFE|nr:lysozyme inhibitor LprI family protein [Massilia rhizosphaerae]
MVTTRSAILYIVITIFSGIAQAQGPICHNDGSGLDSAICAHDDFLKADAQLNNAYQAAIKLLGSDPDRAAAKVALVTAQREWVKFRDADCQVQDRIFQHGSMRAALVESCLKERTEQRTKELKEIWLP